MKKTVFSLILLVLTSTAYSQTTDEINAAYDEIVQMISQGDVDYEAEVGEVLKTDEERIQEEFQKWITAQPIPDTDGEMLEEGSCGPCAPGTGQDPQFEQPGAITIKGKKNADGHYPTSFKVTWKKPKPLKGNSPYELTHYNVYIAKNESSYKIFKVVSENKNQNGNIKNSIRFKGNSFADYAISVQAVYGLKSTKSTKVFGKATNNKSPYTDLTYLTTYASKTTVDSLKGGVRECVVDKSGYQPTQLLSEITRVYCWNNTLKNSDLETMGTFVNLSYLYLYDNKIVTDISPLLNLSNLSGLYIYKNNQINIAPLSSFTSLTTLSVQNMGLTQVPDLSGNQSLYSLQLGNNQIIDFSSLNNIPSLQVLYLNGNNISQVPDLNSLTNLRYIYLNTNILTQVPVLNSLPSLYNLNLSDNQITSGFDNLNALTSLRYLYLDSNSLTQVPDLSALTSLNYLSLANNQLEANDFATLPNTIGDLNLSNNLISNCSGLEGRDIASLSLGGNNLTSIDYCSDINNLTSLRVSSAYNLNTTQNIDSFAGLYTLQFYYTNIEYLTGSRPTSNLYLYYNSQLKSFDLIKPAENTVDNNFPNLIPSVVYLQGNTNMNCSSVYEAKATQEAYPTTDFRTPITTTVGGVTKTTQASTSYNANKTFYPPSSCIPDPITEFSAIKDQASYNYELSWSKQDHDLWGVTNYEVRINGTEIREIPYALELPLTVNIIGASLASFEVRTCLPSATSTQTNPQTVCGEWVSTTTTLGLGKVNNLQYTWVNQSAGTFNLSFDYPQEFTTTNSSTPDFFMVSPGALQVSDATIPTVAFNQGTGSYQTSEIDLDSFFSYQYSVRACKNTTQGPANCGQSIQLTIDNTRPLELSPPVLLSSSGQLSATGNFVFNFAKSADNAGVDIDYFRIKENQPTPVIDGPPRNIVAFDSINGIDNISTFTKDALHDDSASIDLVRKSNGNYRYEITACIRDFKNGDQCSNNPLIIQAQVARTIKNQQDLSHMSNAASEDLNFKNVYLVKGSCNGIDYNTCASGELNSEGIVYGNGSMDWVYISDTKYFVKKYIRWEYNQNANATKPDYFYFSKLNLRNGGKNQYLSSISNSRVAYQGLDVNSCINRSLGITGVNAGNTTEGNYYARQKFIIRSAGEGTYWTTGPACSGGIRVAQDGMWRMQACYDGIGCTNGKIINVAERSGLKSTTIQKSTTAEKEIISKAASQGPLNLQPGLWWNPHQNGTGWYFYWKNNSENPATDLHDSYDLLAYWTTYRSINGVWSPVWMKATMKLGQADAKGNQFFEGPLEYTSFIKSNSGTPGELSVQNIGTLKVLLNSDYALNNKAQIEINITDNKGLMTSYSDIDMDYSGSTDEYRITYNDGNTTSTNVVSSLKIPLELASLRLVDETNTATFGQKHDGTHFQGAWHYSAETNADGSQKNRSPSDVDLLVWKERNLEVDSFFIFDDGQLDEDLGEIVQHPLWIMSQSCGSPCTIASDDYYDSSFNIVSSGFNPLGYNTVFSDLTLNTNIASGARRFVNTADTSFTPYQQGMFSVNISQNSIDPDTKAQARRPVHLSLGSGSNVNMVTMDKIANINFIGIAADDDSLKNWALNPSSVCDLNKEGKCDVYFSWYSDSGDTTIRPFYKTESMTDFVKMPNNISTNMPGVVCDAMPNGQYLVSKYRCSGFSEGVYEFELRSYYSGRWVPIAESEDLEVLACTNVNGCGLTNEPISLLNAPDIIVTPASSDSASDDVGYTQGAFRVDESGAATYSIPIMTPKGTGGLAPSVSLDYSSLAGNGIAGVGWNLSGVSSISRCLHSVEQDGVGVEVKAISFTNEDAFCMNGQRLFVSNNKTNGENLAEYKTEVDNFSLIKSLGVSGNGPATFEVRGKDGLIRTYGTANNSNANVNSNDGNNTINTWLLASVKDKYNNEIRYIWDNKTNDSTFEGEVLLDKIEWTYVSGVVDASGQEVAKYELDFTYENSPHKTISYFYGSNSVSHQRLSDITLRTRILPTSTSLSELRNYMLLYANNDGDSSTIISATGLNHLTSVSECVGATCLAPVKFEYTKSEITQGPYANGHNGIFGRFKYMQNFKFIDINGDGKNEMIFLTAEDPSFWGGGDFRYRFNLAIRHDDLNWTNTDWNSGNWSCPSSDDCNFQSTGFYKFAFDQGFGPIPNSSNLINYSASNWHVIDYNGDGYQDLFARSNVTGKWTAFLSNGYIICKDGSNPGNPYANCTNYAPINTGIVAEEFSQKSALLDFNGDGLVDLIAANGTSNSSFKYHQASLVNGQISLDITDNQIYIENDGLSGLDLDPLCFPGSTNPSWPSCATNLLEFNIVELHHLAADFNGDGYNDAFMRYSLTQFVPGCIEPNSTIVNDSPYYSIVSSNETQTQSPQSPQDTCPTTYYWSAMVFDPNYYKNAQYSHNNEPHFIPYSNVDDGSMPGTLKNVQILDINGDSLTDVAYRKGLQWYYKINDGKEFGLEQNMYIESSVNQDDLADNSFFVDYDYDGDIDILYPYTQVAGEVRFKVRKYEYYDPNDSTTSGCVAYKVTTNCDNDENTDLLARTSSQNSDEYLHFISDLNGDLTLDHLYFKVSDSQHQATAYGQNAWRAKDKISKIIVGQHNINQTAPVSSTEIYYESALLSTVYTRSKNSYALNYGNGSAIFDITMPQYLVRKIETLSPTENDPTNKAKLLYHYSGLKVQGGGRGSLGFETLTTHDYQHNMSTITYYNQEFPFIGMPKDTYTYNLRSLSNLAVHNFSCGFVDAQSTTATCGQQRCDVNQDANQCYVNNPNASNATHLFADDSLTLVTGQYYNLISHKHNEYNMAITNANAASLFAYIDNTSEKQWEFSSLDFQKRIDTSFTYNATDLIYGNLTSNSTKIYNVETAGVAVESKTINNTYYAPSGDDITNWVIGRLKDSTITQSRSEDFSGDNISTAQFVYNAKGQLTKESVDGSTTSSTKAADINQQLFTRHVYDSIYGNEVLTITCSNHSSINCDSVTASTSIPVEQSDQTKILNYTQTIYDSDWHLFVKETKAPFGTSGNATLRTTSKVISRDKYGSPIEIQDIFANSVFNAYGVFGDLQSSNTVTGGFSLTKRRWCDNNTNSSNTVSYCPDTASMVVISEPIGAPVSRAFSDQLGRIVRTQSQSINGDWITVDTTYDMANRVQSVTQPYFIHASSGASDSIYKTTTLYDEVNRITKTTTPTFCMNGITECTGSTTISYMIENKQLKTETKNPKSQTRTEYADATGKIKKTEDSLSNDILYTYNDRGDLASITSYKSTINGATTIAVTITMEYDEYGRKISMIDPDKGSWSYTYNARGDMLTQTDGKNQTLNYTYDMNGRKLSENVSNNKGLGYAARWYYDENGDYGLLSRERQTGEASHQIFKSYYYDTYGRNSQVVTDIIDTDENTTENYSQKTFYDQYGRVFSSIDATGYGQLFQYNDNGYQNKILEAASCTNNISGCHPFVFGSGLADSPDVYRVYYEAINSDAYGNIISSKHHDTISKVVDYDPSTGLPWQITTNNGSIQNQNFKFNKLGNLIERKNIANGTKEVFEYDDLNRLQKTNRYINSNFGSINISETNGYDTTGNLTNKNGTTQSYNPTVANNAGPHAVTSVGAKKYFYDNNGNISYTTGGATNKVYSYMAFDKAYKITMQGTQFHQSEFRYDGNHSRYYRKDIDKDNNVTIKHYLGNVEKIIKADGVSYKRYIGDNLVITLSERPGNIISSQSDWKYDYLFKDHIGSTDVITNENGTVQHRLSFNSWGQRQGTTDLSAYPLTSVLGLLQQAIDITDRGYTGHEQLDGLGLIHMNGRIYDPYIGRFIQADPHIQDPYNTQSLNRYTYVMNNPLTLTDPTGYFSFSRFWNKSGRTIAAIAVTVLSSGAAAGWFTGGVALEGAQAFAVIFSGGFIAGGISSGNLKGAVKGGIFALTANAIGGADFNTAQHIGAHMALSGLDSILSGDKFGHGVISAGFGMLGGYATADIGKGVANLVAGTMVSAIMAGTGSELAGGKFANGALSGALRYAFNAFHHKALKLSNKKLNSKSRHLTKGEKALALSVFGSDINLDDPLIYNKKYRIFQLKNIAMAPNGNVYFNPKGSLYSEDFSKESLSTQALFIHEMTHVWQFQHHVSVVFRAALNRNYDYLPLDPKKSFGDYGVEQQGEIVSDYFILNSGHKFQSPRPSLQTYRNLIPFVK